MSPPYHPPPLSTVRSTAAQCWIAVDSDGCVLDTMEPKHRQCFTPALIDVWGLQAIAPLAREGFLRINLYSEHRGANRFIALHLFWCWLKNRVPQEFLMQNVPPFGRFGEWVCRGGTLSETTLAAELARFPTDAALNQALRWSRLVNQLGQTLPPVRAFAGAAEALAEAAAAGPLYVVSGGNGPAIREEWHATGLQPLVSGFHTQEDGSKTIILRRLAAQPAVGPGLMVGDAPGDAEAAHDAGLRFFPIVPGREEESWHAFQHDVLPAFRAGRYTAAEAQARTEMFHTALAQPAAQPASS